VGRAPASTNILPPVQMLSILLYSASCLVSMVELRDMLGGPWIFNFLSSLLIASL
jgi:hypothetical protein